jgi:hypothetical protein
MLRTAALCYLLEPGARNADADGISYGTRKVCVAAFEELYREFTRSREFGVALHCPDCKALLVEYSCPECRAKGTKATGRTVASSFVMPAAKLFYTVLAICIPVAFGVFGAVVFGRAGGIGGFLLGTGVSSVMISDMLREQHTEEDLTEEKSSRDSFRRTAKLAQRFQDDPATYDQAAACYLAWLTTMAYSQPRDHHSCPDGFAAFVYKYRRSTNAHTDQRTALLNATVAQVCGCCLGQDPWTSALEAAFTGSAEQESLLKSFFAEPSERFGLMTPIVASVLGGDEVTRRLRAESFQNPATG